MRMAKCIHNWNYNKICKQFDQEHDFLIWHYKQLKASIKNQKLRIYQDYCYKIITFEALKEDPQRQVDRKENIESYMSLVQALHVLDFNIYLQL